MVTDDGSAAPPPAAVDARVIDALIAALREGDARAARALGWTGDAQAVQPLMTALDDEGVKEEAARALGRLGDPRAVKRLRGLLRDRSAQVRKAAADALGEIGDPRAVDPLLKAAVRMAAGRPELEPPAARALGRIGEERAVEHFVAMLDDEGYDARLVAVQALGEMADSRAVDALLVQLADGQPGAAEA